jgi:hypothetical protein
VVLHFTVRDTGIGLSSIWATNPQTVYAGRDEAVTPGLSTRHP